MKKLINKSWDYVLYENEGGYYFSVACGTTAVYDISFQLSAMETTEFLKNGENYLAILSDNVRDNNEEYFARRK